MRRKRWQIGVVLVGLLVLLSGCQLQDSYSGKIILSGTHTIGANETVAGELVVLGGKVALQPGSRVSGSVHVFDGSVRIDDDVAGDVLVLAGTVELGPQAVVHGDLNPVGGTVSMQAGAKVLGRIQESAATGEEQPGGQAGRLLTFGLELVLLTGLAYGCARFLPGALANVGLAAIRYWLPSAALGLLAWVVGLSLIVLIAYTILLIPLAVVLFFSMLAASAYGAVPYGIWIGHWISARLGWKVSLRVEAALGMATLICLIEALRWLPIIGPVLPLPLLSAAFGAVWLSRFGMQRFTPPFWKHPMNHFSIDKNNLERLEGTDWRGRLGELRAGEPTFLKPGREIPLLPLL